MICTKKGDILQNRITDSDIEGSVPGDAYSYMDQTKMEIIEDGISCAYCEHMSSSVKEAYSHFKNVHKDIWENNIKCFTSEKKKEDKIIKIVPDLDATIEEERHSYNQSATNKSVCVIDFDVNIKRREIEIPLEKEKVEGDVYLKIKKDKIEKDDIKKLNSILYGYLKYLQKKNDTKNKDKKFLYSQNVSDSKLPNIIKKLLSEDATSVIIKNNKSGNFEVMYTKKEIKEEEDKKLDNIFDLDI